MDSWDNAAKLQDLNYLSPTLNSIPIMQALEKGRGKGGGWTDGIRRRCRRSPIW